MIKARCLPKFLGAAYNLQIGSAQNDFISVCIILKSLDSLTFQMTIRFIIPESYETEFVSSR